MPQAVARTAKRKHTHHFSLSDGTTTLYFNAVDGKGQPNLRAAKSVPYPRTTVQVQTGVGEYSQRRLPYAEISRRDWSGGLGLMDGDIDATKYLMASNVWTMNEGKAILGPMTFPASIAGATTLTTEGKIPRIKLSIGGVQTDPQDLINLAPLTDATLGEIGWRYVADKFTAGITASYTGIRLWCKAWTIPMTIALNPLDNYTYYPINPGTLTVAVYSNSAAGGDHPDAVLATGSINAHHLALHEEYFKFNTALSLTSGTIYWVVIYSSNDEGFEDTEGFPQVLGDGGILGYHGYSALSPLTGGSAKPYWNLVRDNLDIEYARFFTYKQGLYLVLREAGAAGRLFKNGDRGCADVNADLTYLEDATKSWTNDEWVGCMVRIIAGAGVGEYRLIVDNDSNSLQVYPDWTTTHSATTTEYVIVGSTKWTEMATTGLAGVKDVTVSGKGVVYFAQGSAANIRRMVDYNNAGTWTTAYADDSTNKADCILYTYDQQYKDSIWRALNTGQGSIARADAKAWGTDLTFGTDTTMGGTDADITDLIEYEGKIAVMRMGSIYMVYNNVPDKLSIDYQYRWERHNGVNPSVWTPYLVFPFSGGVERSYNNMVEDFGPERGGGMPKRFNGIVADTFSVAGGGIIAKDGGAVLGGNRYYGEIELGSTSESGCYQWSGAGWHKIVTPGWGAGMRAIGYANTEVGIPDFLWLCTRQGLYYQIAPKTWDFLSDFAYDPTYATAMSGYLITGLFSGGEKTLQKYWKRITMYGKLSDTSHISAFYRTSELITDEAKNHMVDRFSDWTWAGYMDSNAESIDINVESREIQFIFILEHDYQQTPDIFNAFNLEYLVRVEASNQYIIPTRASDYAINRQGEYENNTSTTTLVTDVSVISAQLKAWARVITPLTLCSISDDFDNKSVLIEPPAIQPLWLDSQREATLLTIQMVEV